MATKSNGFDPTIIKEIFTGPLKGAIEAMGSATFSKPPEFSEHNLIEYESRMRVFGLEKFSLPCYIAYTNFFLPSADMKKDMPIGALIIFFEHNNAVRLLKSFGYTHINEDEESTLLEKIGEFCATMANKIQAALTQKGYKELRVSPVATFSNDIPEGVPFYYDEKQYYQLDLFFWKQKTLILNLTLGPVPLK